MKPELFVSPTDPNYEKVIENFWESCKKSWMDLARRSMMGGLPARIPSSTLGQEIQLAKAAGFPVDFNEPSLLDRLKAMIDTLPKPPPSNQRIYVNYKGLVVLRELVEDFPISPIGSIPVWHCPMLEFIHKPFAKLWPEIEK